MYTEGLYVYAHLWQCRDIHLECPVVRIRRSARARVCVCMYVCTYMHTCGNAVTFIWNVPSCALGDLRARACVYVCMYVCMYVGI